MKSWVTIGLGLSAAALLAVGCASTAPTAATPAPTVTAAAPAAAPVAAVAEQKAEEQPASVVVVPDAQGNMQVLPAGEQPRTDPGNSVTIKTVDEATGKTVLLTFETIYFDFDKYSIRPEFRSAVAYNAAVLNKEPRLKVMIEGHCDERGTVAYNLALGEHRAVAVMQALTQEGVLKGRLSTVSYGKERPYDVGHNEAAWAKNRRSLMRDSSKPS